MKDDTILSIKSFDGNVFSLSIFNLSLVKIDDKMMLV